MENCRVEVRLAWAGLGFGVFYSIVHRWVFGWGRKCASVVEGVDWTGRVLVCFGFVLGGGEDRGRGWEAAWLWGG